MHQKMIACLVAIGTASCMSAGSAYPRQAHIAAHSAVRAAEEVVATSRPVADAEMQLSAARRDIQKGKKLAARGEHQVARLYFERAEAEAEVALARARAEETVEKAERAEARTGGEEDRGS